MQKKYNDDYKENIKIIINGIRIDKVLLKLSPYIGNSGKVESSTFLGIGHTIKTNLDNDLLVFTISPKIVVHLFSERILDQNREIIYDIEVSDWKAKCILKEIIYGSSLSITGEDIYLIFKVLNHKNNSEDMDSSKIG